MDSKEGVVILFENFRDTFTSGEIISGKVIIRPNQPTELKCLLINALGDETVELRGNNNAEE